MIRNTVALPEEGPGFNPLHPHDRSNLSVTTVSMDPVPSSGFHGHYMPMVHRHTGKQNTRTRNMNKNIL